MKKSDHQLVQQALDGDLSQEMFARFQERLRGEPELVKLYESYVLLHHTLHEELGSGNGVSAAETESSRRGFRPAWLISAAVLMACVAGWLLLPWIGKASADDVAVVTFSVDAGWELDGASRSLGGATGIGEGSTLHLRHGRASISFAPATTVLIEGPAEVTIPALNQLNLTSGRGYFQCRGTGGGLVVTTPRFTALDSGTEFWMDVGDRGNDVVQVIEGSVRISVISDGESMTLRAGDAIRIQSSGLIQRMPADGSPRSKDLGRFKSIACPLEKSQWRVTYGNPEISDGRIDGKNYSVFHALSDADVGSTVMLATLDVGKSAEGEFHTDGWAGMSFFSGGREVLFFGDPFGAGSMWALDVKQGAPVIVPEHSVSGPGMMTLRYDSRTGAVSLHEGGVPLKPAFCSGKIVLGTRFDEIRVGASSGAALAVKSIQLRVSSE